MQIFIGNFTLIFCAIYYFIKLLNLSIGKKKRIGCIIFIFLLAGISVQIEELFPYLTLFIVVSLSIPFLSYYMNMKLEIVIPVIIVAYGISYILFTWAVTVTSIGSVTFPVFEDANHILLQILVLVVVVIIMPLPFCMKRLKKGMPFLKKERNRTVGMLICLTVLVIGSFFNNNMKHFFLFVTIYICTILVYIYWRKNISKAYLEKLQARNMEDLNGLITRQQEQIKELEQENVRLAEIIHRDNKLIPAMEYAVKCYLDSSSDDLEEKNNIGKKLLLDLEKMSDERKNIIKVQDRQCQKLMSTKVMSIDRLLQYMQQKATKQDITLNMIISCDLSNFIEQVVEEEEVNTLLADLIENALIATKYNQQKQVLINFSFISNAYSINIFDSGIPFEKEVLFYFGLKQITTHEDDEGSGIGLMTTKSFLQKYQASMVIDEFNSNAGGFTKGISIIFNGLNQFILKTERSENEIAYLKTRRDLQIIRK